MTRHNKPLINVKVTNIAFDTDGDDVSLPSSLEFSYSIALSPEELEQTVSDAISNSTGYCHNGFTMVFGDCVARDVCVEFANDHYKHFECYPGEVAFEDNKGVETVYDFDNYMRLACI